MNLGGKFSHYTFAIEREWFVRSIFRAFLCVAFAILLTVQPVMAKLVKLDVLNGAPEERQVLGPFCKQLRMQLEDKWSPVYSGYLSGQKETTIRMLVLKNGRIVTPDAENPNNSQEEKLAIGVVTELANETGVIVPGGKEYLEISATFKLRTQGPNRPGLEELVAGLLALAAVAAAGYAVYKLGTMNNIPKS